MWVFKAFQKRSVSCWVLSFNGRVFHRKERTSESYSNLFFFSLFPISGWCIQFSISTFSGLVLLKPLNVKLKMVWCGLDPHHCFLCCAGLRRTCMRLSVSHCHTQDHNVVLNVSTIVCNFCQVEGAMLKIYITTHDSIILCPSNL